MKRVSVTFFLDSDELTARQVKDATEGFVKRNFGVKDEQIIGNIRTPKYEKMKKDFGR